MSVFCLDNVILLRHKNMMLVSFNSNTTSATSGAGTADFQTTRAHPRVSGVRVAQSLVFCVVYLRSMLVFSLLVIVLSALLRFTASDNHFGVFKLFIYD